MVISVLHVFRHFANFQSLDSEIEHTLYVAKQHLQGWAGLALFYLDNLDISIIFIHTFKNITRRGYFN